MRNRNSAKEILSPTRQNTLNTPFKDQGRVWWVRPQKLSQEVKRGGRKKMGECCFKRLTHNYDMAIYQSNWQQPKMDCNVYVSNIFKYPEIRQIWCVHWYTAEASAEERGRGAKFMRWDGGGNTFPLMSRDYSTYHCRTELSM